MPRVALGAAGLDGGHRRQVVRAVAACFACAAVLLVTAFNEHDPYDVGAGLVTRVVAGLVPLVAGALAGAAVLRPKVGYLGILLLTPVVDVAQVHLTVGPVQVISQTVLLAALCIGLALRDAELQPEPRPEPARGRAAEGAGTDATGPPPGSGWRSRVPLPAAAAAATLLFLTVAALSTAASPKVETSTTVLLHGILEPVGMGAVLLALRPTRRDVVLVAVVLGVSVALGGLLNMIQTLGEVRTLSGLQAQRLLFSRITYFNVGLFGEMLAMAMPLLLAALVARRRLDLRRSVVLLLAAAMVTALASLFLTFSKSAYLATAAGSLLLLLLIVHSWWRRASIVLAAVLLSGAVIPWPALFLRVSPPLEEAYRSAVVSLVGQSRYDSWDPSTLSGRGSLLERWYATRAAVAMAVDHPLLGIGLDQFKTQYVGRYKPPEADLDLDSAHTFWPEIAAELGLPALALATLVFAAAALSLWRLYRSPPDEATRILAATLLAALVAWLMVATTFDVDLYREWRNMSSDVVMMAVITAAAFALCECTRRGTRDGTAAGAAGWARGEATTRAAAG
jgi:O-antigen ligase